MRNLPIKLQIQKINHLLSKKGISPDLIDTNSRIDRTLTYRENLRGINNYLGRSIYPNEIKGRTSSYEANKPPFIYFHFLDADYALKYTPPFF